MSAAAAATASLVAGVLGTGTAIIGAQEQGAAQRAQANYQAQVAANNQIIAQNQAQQQMAAGEQQAAQTEMGARAKVGAIKAAQAASNIDVNSGSAVDVRSSAAQLGELDALTVRSNAARQAYGFETTAASEAAQSQIYRSAGEQASTAADISSLSSFLSGASSTGKNYAQWSILSGSNAAANPFG